jgi:DNA-binding HxlR family transcriptional regulator
VLEVVDRTISLEVLAVLGISPKTLSSRLRRFVLTGLVTRTAYPEIPPRVEYQLSPEGARLKVVLATMAAWAEQDLPRNAQNPVPSLQRMRTSGLESHRLHLE